MLFHGLKSGIHSPAGPRFALTPGTLSGGHTFVYLKARRGGKNVTSAHVELRVPQSDTSSTALCKSKTLPAGRAAPHESSAQSFTVLNNSWPGKCVHKQLLGRAGSCSRGGCAAAAAVEDLSGLSSDPWSSKPPNFAACPPSRALCPSRWKSQCLRQAQISVTRQN